MQLPTIFPRELLVYSSAETDSQLFETLLKKPVDLIYFLIHACEDETWSEEHSEFMKSALEWLTLRAAEGRLSMETMCKLAQAIQPHFTILNPFIMKNLSVVLKKETVEINSLLFGASSDFFHDLVISHFKGVLSIEIPLEGVSRAMFEKMETVINTGTVEDIWKMHEKELISLLKRARKLGLSSLVSLCEDTIKRYINKFNVINYLITAHKETWSHLKAHCCEFINEQSWGIKVHSELSEMDHQTFNPLQFEFLIFSNHAIEIFDQLKPYITHLVCSENLTEESFFSIAVQSCPKLASVDISRSKDYTDRLSDLPYDLEALDLSRCPWVTNPILKKIFSFCPQLKTLGLASDVQLTFIGWSELQKLQDLRTLNVSRNHQFHDEDLTLVLRGCSRLTHLNLEECRHLSDRSFFELAKLSLLDYLNVSRTHISDESLLEITDRCSLLRTLKLTRCAQITQRGLLQAVKQANNLELLEIKNIAVSESAMKQIKLLRPRLTIVD